MIYVYAPTKPQGYEELVKALNAKLLQRFDGYNFVNKGRPIEFNRNDAIVCWGSHVPPIDGVVMLNASYKWIDQLGINKQLTKICAPYTSFEPQAMLPSEYQQAMALAQECDWRFKSTPLGMCVPLKEFENYGSRFYKFTRRGTMLVVNGHIVLEKNHGGSGSLEKDKSTVLAIAANVGLDFCRISYGVATDTFVALKILTAPFLTKERAEKYATHLRNLLQIKQTKANSLNNMQELLEL